MRDADQKKLDEILNKYNGAEGFLIQLLLDLQSEFNWIPDIQDCQFLQSDEP